MTHRVEVVPVDAPIGAIIRGIDPGLPLGDDDRLTILRAISEFGVVVLRGHDSLPSLEAYRDFGRRFGPLRESVADLSRFPTVPEVNLVSNREFEGVVGTGGSGLIDWHADMNFACPATDYVVLDAVELPESGGGATRFADLCAAYDALGAHDRERIELAEVRYFFRNDLPYAQLSDEQRQSLKSITHALVQTRFPSRRRSLWPNVGIFDGVVVGDPGESRDMLDTLLHHAIDERRVYEHEWVQGDCAMWSNWTTFHQRLPFDDRHRRRMRHLTVSEGGPQP